MPTILIVSHALTSHLGVGLASAGYSIIDFHPDEEPRGSIDQKPGVVIMPDGKDTPDNRKLRAKIPGLEAAHFIVVGNGDSRRRAEAMFEGADAYMSVPVDPVVLRSRIKALLRRSGARMRTDDRR